MLSIFSNVSPPGVGCVTIQTLNELAVSGGKYLTRGPH
jgi:hypothetical protein